MSGVGCARRLSGHICRETLQHSTPSTTSREPPNLYLLEVMILAEISFDTKAMTVEGFEPLPVLDTVYPIIQRLQPELMNSYCGVDVTDVRSISVPNAGVVVGRNRNGVIYASIRLAERRTAET